MRSPVRIRLSAPSLSSTLYQWARGFFFYHREGDFGRPRDFFVNELVQKKHLRALIYNGLQRVNECHILAVAWFFWSKQNTILRCRIIHFLLIDLLFDDLFLTFFGRPRLWKGYCCQCKRPGDRLPGLLYQRVQLYVVCHKTAAERRSGRYLTYFLSVVSVFA